MGERGLLSMVEPYITQVAFNWNEAISGKAIAVF